MKVEAKETVKVEVKDGNLIISVPIISPPKLSRSGKNLVVATTHGRVETEVEIDGKRVVVNTNADIPK